MSKLWKGVKKVFKKVGKFVKKYWKYIAIAVAIYFTAGVALAAMPSTAAFSAAMPGFGVGQVFSNAAVAMGATGAAGSGIAGTVAANAAAAAAASGAGAVGASAAAGGAGLGSAGGGAGFVMPGAASSAGTAAAANSAAAAGLTTSATGATATGAASGVVGGVAAKGTTAALAAQGASAVSQTAAQTAATKGVISGMSGLEKVALAGTVFKGASGLLSDSENSINKKQHARMYGQSYGIGRDGTGPGMSGLVSDAWGGRFGGEETESNADKVTPFTPTPVPQTQDSSPFNDMNYSEQEASRDAGYVNQGYRNKDYRPG